MCPFSQRFTVETVTPIACANSSWVMFKRRRKALIGEPNDCVSVGIASPFAEHLRFIASESTARATVFLVLVVNPGAYFALLGVSHHCRLAGMGTTKAVDF